MSVGALLGLAETVLALDLDVIKAVLELRSSVSQAICEAR
jgi:hypothetical protein